MARHGVALVGCGGIGHAHLERWRKIETAQVRWAIDVDEGRARQTAEKYGIPHVATQLEQALQDPEVDVVDVCLPTFLHADAVETAARAGRHILCEKPMAMSLEQADRMIAASRRHGVKLQIALCRRFDNYWLTFKEIVQSGRLGRPVVWRSVTAGPGPAAAWFFGAETGGGPLLDGAIHNIDFAYYMFGPAVEVVAMGRSLQEEHTAPDTALAGIRFASGDQLHLMWSWGLPKGTSGGGVHDVLGPRGVMQFDDGNYWSRQTTEGAFKLLLEGGERSEVRYVKNDMYLDEMLALLKAIDEGGDPPVTGEVARPGLEIGLAVLEAMRTGGVVRLRQGEAA